MEETGLSSAYVGLAMQNRKDEDSRLRLRREDRVHLSLGQWYIDTREGIEVGPFCSKADAMVAAEKLINQLANLLPDEDAMPAIREFDIDAWLDEWPVKPECA